MSQSFNFHSLWYDSATTARGWIDASQTFQDWVTGIMTRAFRRSAGMNSFAIHLFIDAWPAGWMKTIMDVACTPKKAWFTYRDALAPLAVSLRTDRSQVSGGEVIPVELWLCNDLPDETGILTVEYDVTLDGRLIASGRSPSAASACAPACQGLLQVKVPVVNQRSVLTIAATLIDAAGQAIHGHEIGLDVFPALPVRNAAVWCPGAEEATLRFVKRLGLEPVDYAEDADAILIVGARGLSDHMAAILSRVQAGASAVLLELPPANYHLGSASITVREAGMGPRHFVSRATGHPLVEGFEPNDFRFWFQCCPTRALNGSPIKH